MNKGIQFLMIVAGSLVGFGAQADNKWVDNVEEIHNVFAGESKLKDALNRIVLPSNDPNDQPSDEVAAIINKTTESCKIAIIKGASGLKFTISGPNCVDPSTGGGKLLQQTAKQIHFQTQSITAIKDADLMSQLHIKSLNESSDITQVTDKNIIKSQITTNGTVIGLKIGTTPFVAVLKALANEKDSNANTININLTFTYNKTKVNVWANIENENLTCAIAGQKGVGQDCLGALYIMGLDFGKIKNLARSASFIQ